MALTKVALTSLAALAETASNSVTVGAEVSVATYYGAIVRIRAGRGTGTAFTRGPIFRLEGTADASSPNANQWTVLAQFSMALGSATIGSQAVSGTEAAGQTVITLAAGTNFAAGNYVLFHNGTIGNSEWSRVVSISGADLTIEEGIINAQTGATARNEAEQYIAQVDLTGIDAIRLVVDGANSGQAVIVEADFGAVSGL